jgi:hypothetical protein
MALVTSKKRIGDAVVIEMVGSVCVPTAWGAQAQSGITPLSTR